jgi:hypothetical protein
MIEVAVPSADPDLRDMDRLADAWAAMAVQAVLEPDDDYVMRNLALLLRQLSRATPLN